MKTYILYFSEFKEKIKVVDKEKEDSLTYSPFDIYKFNEQESGNLSENDYVTILNPLIVVSLNNF